MNQPWGALTRNELKLNIGGSFSPANGSVGWGFVIRNTHCEVMATGAGSLPYAYNALHSEAATCLAGIQWSSFWRMSKIHVETDSQKLVQAITSEAYDLSISGHLFREIMYYARLNLSSFSVKFCPRAYNKVADALAMYATELGHESPAIWLDGAPNFVLGLVTSDIAGVTG